MKRILAVVLFLSALSPTVVASSCLNPVGEDPVKSADYLVVNNERVFFGTVKSYEFITRSRKGHPRHFWVTVSVDKNIKGVAGQETVEFYWALIYGAFSPENFLGKPFLFWNNLMYIELFDDYRRITRYPIVVNHDKPVLFSEGSCQIMKSRADYELANWAEQPRRTYLRFLSRLWQLAEQNE